MGKSRLIFYDTSNYVDFPIGGQLTSVGNLLRYLAECHPERTGDVVLVGVTPDPSAVGKLSVLERAGQRFRFLPVAAAERDLSHTAHSLRLAFARGLVRYGRQLKITRQDCNYVQTPEAVGPVRLLCPGARYVIFSHGSYRNMARGFRFYRGNPLVMKGFAAYLRYVLKHAALIFVLDADSEKDYKPYSSRIVRAKNTIALPENYERFVPHDFRGRLLFVGRLSKDKGVDGIIRALSLLPEATGLTIVGDGEYGDTLRSMAAAPGKPADVAGKETAGDKTAKPAGDRITFTGAVTPDRVAAYMEDSDLLVMNSAFEGVPMTILEALSHGLPVISTDVGGIGDTVRFGSDALATDGTPESIAEAVRAIARDYRRFSEAAHGDAKQYDYRTANAELYTHLQSVWKE